MRATLRIVSLISRFSSEIDSAGQDTSGAADDPPTPERWTERLVNRWPWVTDAAVVLTFLWLECGYLYYAIFLAETPVLEAPTAVVVVLNISGALSLLVRRRYPVLVLAWIVAIAFFQWAVFGEVDPASVIIIPALFAAAAHEPNRKRALASCLIFGSIVVGIDNVAISGEADHAVEFLQNGIIAVSIALAGDHSWHRRAHLAELKKKNELLEESQAAEASRAVQAERSRVARELHDVIAHSVSVMVVQATAARRVIASSPDDSIRALESIEHTGRESLSDLRRVLGLLREESLPSSNSLNNRSASYVSTPSLEQLPTLVQTVNKAGMDVQLARMRIDREVPAAVGLAAYRIIQEALTNIMKHAGQASTVITTEVKDNLLALSVTDNGRGAASEATEGAGRGLLGMRERAQLFGGTLQAGPRSGGGFEVIATLPFEGSDSAFLPSEQTPLTKTENTQPSQQPEKL